MVNILLIPDGSRRAARKDGISYFEAYRLASEKIDMAIKFLLERDGVDNLAVYGLSYDNLVQRDHSEIEPVFKVQEERCRLYLRDPFFASKRVRVIFHGDINLFFEYLPPSYIEALRELEEKTYNYDWKKLFILIGHSGRREAKRYRSWNHDISYIEQAEKPVPPDIDLVIRTGGSARLSDALLHQTAYSELYVMDKLITEIDFSDLSLALKTLEATVRNFGG